MNLKNKKMKVLWIAYQALPNILKDIKQDTCIVTGGWLQGAADVVCLHDDIELYYCFQYHELLEGKVDGVKYYTMPIVPVIHSRDISKYKEKDYLRFKQFVNEINPDVIHIFGTETWFQRQFVHMINKLGLMKKTIVWIQGLTSFCSNCYTDGLTVNEFKKKTIWELIRGTNIEGIQRRLYLNGLGETRVISMLKNVFIRTEWDAACCKAINSKLKMYKCNETLRPAFYEDKIWNINNIQKHSIFMSQCGTPIKGFHQMLKALPIILKEFPDAILYTTGRDLINVNNNLVGKLRESSYDKILRKIIIDNNMAENVCFLGTLQSEDMRERYIKSHVFVSASNIENSPNSVGEAMLLGVPVVASDVGGVSSMITHKEEGLLYPFNEYALLAEYICMIFRKNDLAADLSKCARLRALKVHNKDMNYNAMYNAYIKIINDIDLEEDI